MICEYCSSSNVKQELVKRGVVIAPSAWDKSYSPHIKSIGNIHYWKWIAKNDHNLNTCYNCGKTNRTSI